MGYTTEFTGHVTVEPPLNRHEVAYLNRFADSRRFVRRSGPYQTETESTRYRSGDTLEYNAPATEQPGLWCNWVASDDGSLIGWNGAEKFYYADDWMRYLIDTFLSPNASLKAELSNRVEGRYYADEFDHFTFDHVLSGDIEAAGERADDRWRLSVRANVVERVEANAADAEVATAGIPAEPADKSFVVWFDKNGDPWAVFRREDRHAVGTNRWMNTDQFNNNDDEPWAWPALCAEMDGFDGPHMLALVRSPAAPDRRQAVIDAAEAAIDLWNDPDYDDTDDVDGDGERVWARLAQAVQEMRDTQAAEVTS